MQFFKLLIFIKVNFNWFCLSFIALSNLKLIRLYSTRFEDCYIVINKNFVVHIYILYKSLLVPCAEPASQILKSPDAYVVTQHWVRHGGGARGAMAPPPKNGLGGASNAFGPPNFLGKFCYETQLMYKCFSLKHWKCMHVMHVTVEYMHRLLCIVHTICIDTSTNTIYTVHACA